MSDVKENVKEAVQTAELKIKGNWNEIKGKMKQKYAQLTDDDLKFVEGKEEELFGRLQQKLSVSKEEVQKIINGFTGQAKA